LTGKAAVFFDWKKLPEESVTHRIMAKVGKQPLAEATGTDHQQRIGKTCSSRPKVRSVITESKVFGIEIYRS
jgi:hypothetical protein